MNSISDNYNIGYFRNVDSLINPTSNSKQLSLSCCNVNSLMLAFKTTIIEIGSIAVLAKILSSLQR